MWTTIEVGLERLRTEMISPGRLVLVEQALCALDRLDQARKIIEKEGLVLKTESTGALHANPAVKIERENRALFARLWNNLGLDWDMVLKKRLKDWSYGRGLVGRGTSSPVINWAARFLVM